MSVSTTEMTDKFGTGAVRSKDAEGERYDLISPIALRELARTYAEGATKYSDFNWEKGMPAHDLLNHAIRHVYLFLSGDRSEPHLPHALWGLGAAIHSLEMWPHLNAGHLRGPGCKPPAADWTDRLSADSAEPGAMVYVDDEPIGTLPIDEPGAGDPSPWLVKAASDMKDAFGVTFAQMFGKAAQAPAGDGASTPPSRPETVAFEKAMAEALAYLDGSPDAPRGNGYTGLPFVLGGMCGAFDAATDDGEPPAVLDAATVRLRMLADAWRGRPRPVVYLSGPMSGIPEYNFPAFNRAADYLRTRGFPVVNPADFGADPAISWEECLQRDLAVMGYAQIVVQLPGWEQSAGASLEFHVADRLKKAVISYADAARLASLLDSAG